MGGRMGDRESILQYSNISITYSGNDNVTLRPKCSPITSSTKGNYKDRNIEVSRPLLALHLGEYWFRISLCVYDRNRPHATVPDRRSRVLEVVIARR